MFTLILLSIALLYLVVYLRKAYSRFSSYGVNHMKPIPLLGNSADMAISKIHVAKQNQKLYHAFPNDRFVGIYELTRPLIMIRDRELIKKILLKDFEHFLDHRRLIDSSVDRLFGRVLLCLEGQEWKDMRSTLSPAFTSAKIKNMVPFIMEISDQLMNFINNRLKDSKENYTDFDVKDFTTRYTNDVIASCAFGLKLNSHKDDTNDFYSVAKSSIHFGFKRILILLGYSVIPAIMKAFHLKFIEDDVRLYLKNIVLKNMQEREEKNLIRPDMIHLLMEANKGKLTHDDTKSTERDGAFAAVQESDFGKRTVNRVWSDDDLVAQAFIFLFAGFETISTTMSFLLYELALNPEVQERLVREIKDNEAKNEKLDFNTIQNLRYLDMVVAEGLRMWPPLVGLDRNCTKDYNLGKPHDKATKDYIMRKDEILVIPVWAIHRDPEYFPEPEKFDPERFSEENKDNIKPFSYIPFGFGPRNCLGSRFALCEVKIMIYQFLLNFQVSPSEKTSVPAELQPDTFILVMKGGHWLRIRPRN